MYQVYYQQKKQGRKPPYIRSKRDKKIENESEIERERERDRKRERERERKRER